MRKFTLFILILFVFLYLPQAAHAQQAISFDSIQIDLWPEYDQPAMLVIYRATLAAGTTYPATLAIRIPASAGEPNAVAVRQEGGLPVNVAYERQVLGEWATLILTTDAPGLQIEYYDPGIERNGTSRRFQYNWPGDYAVGNVILLVQQPTGAENITTFPNLGSQTQDDYGLFYYGGEIGSIAAGETFDLTVTYEKQSDVLTVNYLPVESSQPVSEETAGRVNVGDYLPLGLGMLGGVVIMVGVYWYWSTGRKLGASRAIPRRATPSKQAMEPELHVNEGDVQSVFCQQCGKRAEAGDKFCRACGTKLRV